MDSGYPQAAELRLLLNRVVAHDQFMRFLLLVLLTLVTLGAGAASAAPLGAYGWPLSPRPAVTRPFDNPVHDWLPGHRGVDLAAAPGQSVLAAGPGIVAFAGEIADKTVVSIDHPNGLRTTYEPIRATVTAGQRVSRGTVIGTLEPGHPDCSASACLHWGLRRGHEYLDPLGLIHVAPIRLKPVRPAD
jgi:murein DD-endopeptidase MepM/ murein hydrolase activator NlpD